MTIYGALRNIEQMECIYSIFCNIHTAHHLHGEMQFQLSHRTVNHHHAAFGISFCFYKCSLIL